MPNGINGDAFLPIEASFFMVFRCFGEGVEDSDLVYVQRSGFAENFLEQLGSRP
jgi:hypothetical protein